MNKLSIVALIIAVIAVGMHFISIGDEGVSFGAANCAGGVTCFTDLAATNTLQTDGTFSATATTTLSDTVNFDNAGLCINFYATSTATRLNLVASTTGTLPGSAAAVMTANYGSCTN